MKAWRIDPVAVEVPDERLVARIAEHVRMVGSTEAAVVGPELVDDVERLVRRSIDRHRVASVGVEVTGDRHISGVPEEERDVRVALRVRVAQIHVPVGLAVQARSVDPVAIPVTGERIVAGVPEVELARLGGTVVQVPYPRGGIDQSVAVLGCHEALAFEGLASRCRAERHECRDHQRHCREQQPDPACDAHPDLPRHLRRREGEVMVGSWRPPGRQRRVASAVETISPSSYSSTLGRGSWEIEEFRVFRRAARPRRCRRLSRESGFSRTFRSPGASRIHRT